MRILIVKTSSLGDVIHALPVVTDLRQSFPDVRIDWCVEESFAAIPRLHPGVARVITVAVRRWRKRLAAPATWRELLAARRTLRESPYDCVLDLQGLLKSAWIASQAVGPISGYAAEAVREPAAARYYDHTFLIPKNVHAVDRNRWLAAAALAMPMDRPLDYGIAVKPAVADWLPAQPYVTLLTATSRDDKLWPEIDWRALGAELGERGLAMVLPAGSARERERAERLASAITGAVVAPPLGIDRLAEVIAGGVGAIGVDTGLTHLAAALATPVVALYTATEPGLTGVLSGGAYRNLGGRNASPSVAAVLAAFDACRRA